MNNVKVQVKNQTWNESWDNVRKQLLDRVWEQAGDPWLWQIRAQVRDQIQRAIGNIVP